jgi:hypothetical protein
MERRPNGYSVESFIVKPLFTVTYNNPKMVPGLHQ